MSLRSPAPADGRARDLHAARARAVRRADAGAALQPHRLLGRARRRRPAAPRSTRGCRPRVDWDATIAYRQRLWSLGLGVAEAMDTAQRGMGLDWPTSLELIRRSLDAARDMPGALVASGCGTDHLALDAGDDASTTSIRAYEEQMAAIEALGGRLIVMASRALARVAHRPGRLRARLRPHPDAGRSSR